MFTCSIQFFPISSFYLLVSSNWALLHLKRTPQSLNPDRQKGTAKIQTKDTSKRIDVFFALHDFTFENIGRPFCASMLVVLVLQSIQTIDIWMQYASTEMFYWNENCICLPFQKYDWNLSCTLLHIDIPGISRIAQGGTYHIRPCGTITKEFQFWNSKHLWIK